MKNYLGAFIILVSITTLPLLVSAKNDYPGEPDTMPPEYFEKLCTDNAMDNQEFDGEYCVCRPPYVRSTELGFIDGGEGKKLQQFSNAWNGKYYTHGVYECILPEVTLAPEEGQAKAPALTPLTLDAIVPGDNYSNRMGDGEISLDGGAEYLSSIKDGATEALYQGKLRAWEQGVRDAEQKGAFKDDTSKDEYSKKLAEEKSIKSQLVEVQKILGFNHVRVLESTKTFKFENQSREYQNYWKQPVENNAFDDTTNATAFNAAAANATAYAEQSRELTKKLQDTYPTGWKTKYLAVPEKPQREKPIAPIFKSTS